MSVYLSPSIQFKIETTVDKLLLSMDYESNYFVDIHAILSKMKIEYYEVDLTDLGGNVQGIIQKSADASKILVEINQSPQKKRFTLAHELGHYILHEFDQNVKYRIDRYDFSNDTQESREEAEANYFAAALLMPRERFVKAMQISHDISDISTLFGVSESAVNVRLNWLQKNN